MYGLFKLHIKIVTDYHFAIPIYMNSINMYILVVNLNTKHELHVSEHIIVCNQWIKRFNYNYVVISLNWQSYASIYIYTYVSP